MSEGMNDKHSQPTANAGSCHAVEYVQAEIQWEPLGGNLGLPQADGQGFLTP